MRFLQQVAADGTLHGLMDELANDSQESDMNKLNERIKNECQMRKEDDATVLRARYLNKHGRGEWMDKAYCRWPGDRIQIWRLLHGHEYDLPKGLINEVNNGAVDQGGGLIERTREEFARNERESGAVTNERKRDKIHELVPVSF
jgi:hypothetical protein